MSKFYDQFWKKRKGKYLEDFSFKWPVLKKIISLKNKQKVLDFGCGTGKLIQKIEQLYPDNKYTGVDVSETAIKIAKKTNHQANFHTIQDGDKFPFKSGHFDFILAADVIEHVYNTNQTFSELSRVLKKGGKILITTPYYGLFKNLIIVLFGFEKVFDPIGPHIRFFSKKSLFFLLKSEGLKIITYGYFGRFFPIPRSIYVIAKK